MQMGWLGAACALLSVALCAAVRGGEGTESFVWTPGVQLYSLRAQFMSEGPSKALDRIKEFGFKEVELAGTANLPPEKFKALLDERGLVAVSGHFSYDRLKKDPEGVAKEAKALGLKYAGCAWIGHKPPFNEAACRDAIATFNKAGEVLKKEGIQFKYHVHGYEFHPHAEGTLFDLFMKETNPEFVAIQMDVLWVVFPGQDPVKLLEKYGSRIHSLHLKDLKKGVALGSLSGGTDKKNDVPLGTGQMDWPAILRAAKKAGVKHYFIEDESPDVLTQIPESLKYLGSVKL